MNYSDKQIREFLGKFYESIEMPGGWTFNQPEMLKLIDLYYNSKFKTGKYDNKGFRKFFFNVVKPVCDIATKFIDLDTRDINLTPEMGGDELRIFLMQRRLRQWLKDEDFGVLLNDITFAWPIAGHIVLKKSRAGWGLVPIQNLRMDTTVKRLKDSHCVAEIYVMGRGEIADQGWLLERIQEMYLRGQEEEFVIYDIFEKKGKKWYRRVLGDVWSYKTKDGMNRSVESEINRTSEDWIGSITLFEGEVDKLPYRELKWEDVPGRWLGRGYVEYLEDNQVAFNETENLERKGLALSSLKLWQTRDEQIGGQNVLVNADNGDIVKTESEITPIAMEERNLAQYQETRANWKENVERKTFTSDITTGASLPSRTPLGVANLQASLASSFFERKREELGLFVKRLLLDDIIPDFASDTVLEHTLVFNGNDEELTWLDDAIADTMVGEKVVDYALETGWFPSQEQKQLIRTQIKDKLKGQKNRYLRIPDSFWKNAHYYVDINITGESFDVSVKSQILQMAMQIVGTNPAVLQNPAGKAILFKLLNIGGINPVELNLVDQPNQPAPPTQVAGSLARPTAPTGMSAPVASPVG